MEATNNKSEKVDPILMRLEASKKQKEHENTFRDAFSEKTYYEEYYAAWNFADRCRFIFSLFSIAAAFYLIYSGLSEIMPDFLAVGITALFLVGIEVAKHLLLPINLKKLYTKGSEKYLGNSWNWVFIVFNLFLVALSVYMSVLGIGEFNKNERAIKPKLIDEARLANGFDKKRDSTDKYYRRLILEKRKHIRGVENSINKDKKDPANYYQGKFSWNLSKDHLKRRRDISNYNQQIGNLEIARIKAIDELKDYKKGKLDLTIARNEIETEKALEKTQSNTLLLVGLSGLNELFLIICLWYSVFYPYRCDRQKKQLEELFVDSDFVEWEDRFRVVMKRAFWFYKEESRDFAENSLMPEALSTVQTDDKASQQSKQDNTNEKGESPSWVGELTKVLSKQQEEINSLRAPQIDIQAEIAKGVQAFIESADLIGNQKSTMGEISLRPSSMKKTKTRDKPNSGEDTIKNVFEIKQVAIPTRTKDSDDDFLTKYAQEIIKVQQFYKERKQKGMPKRVTNVALAKTTGLSDKTASKLKKKMIAGGLLTNEDILLDK